MTLFYMQNEIDIHIKALINELEKTVKKADAGALYKAILELCKFGKNCDIIDNTTFLYYIDLAKTQLYNILH